MILRDIIFKGKHTFKDFMVGGEAIATNILTDRLKRLEEIGVISRNRQKGRKEVYYSITEKGTDLIPALIEIVLWSAKHDPLTEAYPDFVHLAKQNRKAIIQKYKKSANGGEHEKQ